MDMSFKRPQTQSAWEQASGKQQQSQCGSPQPQRQPVVPQRLIARPMRAAYLRVTPKIWHEGAD